MFGRVIVWSEFMSGWDFSFVSGIEDFELRLGDIRATPRKIIIQINFTYRFMQFIFHERRVERLYKIQFISNFTNLVKK